MKKNYILYLIYIKINFRKMKVNFKFFVFNKKIKKYKFIMEKFNLIIYIFSFFTIFTLLRGYYLNDITN